jgi:hypothetical protein
MPRWTKWLLVAALIAVPTIGFAVTKYRAHKSCPITPDCPCAKAHK